MKRLLFQAVFLATGMIMGVYASGDVGLDLMCGALVAGGCCAGGGCGEGRRACGGVLCRGGGIRVGFVACDGVDCHA